MSKTLLNVADLKDHIKNMPDDILIEIGVQDEEGIGLYLVDKNNVKFNDQKRTIQFKVEVQ